jgi:hypothetical protein
MNDDVIYLARKGQNVVAHTSVEAMAKLDHVQPEKTVSRQEWEAAGGIARIIGNAIFIGKTPQEAAKETETVQLKAEYNALQGELAAKDYKVVKASEAGLVLKDTEPELHERREWCRARINEIRARLAALDTAP